MTVSSIKLALFPKYSREDRAEGGVRRVVEAQLKYLPKFGVELVEDIRQADIVAVHAGEYISKRYHDAPRVFHCHGLYWANYEWSDGIKTFNRGLVANAHKSEAVTTPCEWVADVFRREMLIDPHVIYNGVDLPTGKPVDSLGYVLWNKARPNPVCNPIWVDKLARATPKVKFLTTFMPEHVRLSNVRETGALPFQEAIDLVARAGVYLSTTQEVFSVGVLEAMSYGVPVLGFDYGGNSEAVEHGKSGYLVPPGDLKGLREGLDYCLSHRAELSEGARERARQFSWPNAMQQYVDLYEHVLLNAPSATVSVVIPCYNLGKYVREAVDSVLAQDIPGVEIIVVDDCSTDPQTIQALNDLKKLYPKVFVVRTPENLYLAHALNFGYARASGRYFMSLDADNRLPPGTLAKLVAVLDKHENLDCTYGAIQFIKETGEPESKVGPGGIPRATWPPERFNLIRQLRHENQAPSTSLFRRALWERAGGYRQHAMFGDDADLWTRTAAMGFKFQRATSQPTLQYRQRDDSMTTTSGPDVHYDWTRWTPKHRALMGVNAEPPIHDVKISIIVKNWNDNLIQTRDAIEALWAQSFDDWEVILENAEVSSIRGFFPPYVRYGGDPRGDLILELFGWEWLEPDALEQLWKTYTSAPDKPKLVYSDFTVYDEGDRGPWHVVNPRQVIAQENSDVGVVLYKPGVEPELAIHLPAPILNRRNKGGRIMACPTCGHGRARTINRQEQAPSSASARSRGALAAEGEDTILVEFTGTGTRTVPVGGGRSYRFGEDREHRVRRVRVADVAAFQNRSMYRVVEMGEETPEIEAAAAYVEEGKPLDEEPLVNVDEPLLTDADEFEKQTNPDVLDPGQADGSGDDADSQTVTRRGRPSSR